MIQQTLEQGGHKWEKKINLVTVVKGRGGGYDQYQCGILRLCW